jgi:membrane protein implicated in regulation of membrane protease activity
MTWSDFYLICFVVGFALSLVSFLSGAMRWHLHLPHFPHMHGGPAHLPVGHAPAAGGHAGAPSAAGSAPVDAHAHFVHVSPFNFVTLTAFLAWFGGTGFLLTRYSSVWFALGLVLAIAAGLVGAAIVFLFLTKVLMSREENLDPADFEMVGVLGKLSNPIREGGTGEIIYSQAGTRRTCGARSDEGVAIAKGVEVVVTRYEKGIAYVRLWEDMAGEKQE